MISAKEANYGYVMDITRIGPVPIVWISPTNRKKLEAQKTCDIIHPSS
jgi:hypothetical protein